MNKQTTDATDINKNKRLNQSIKPQNKAQFNVYAYLGIDEACK